MSLALIFPGQGSQHVGMASPLAASEPLAAEVLRTADDVLGFSLSRLMADGPEDELTATKNAQPALLAHSVAVLRVLGDRVGAPAFAAGHSLGEFSAHVAAGTLTFEDALAAVRLRGELMFTTGRARPGAMAAILGLDDHTVEDVCTRVEKGICVPANFNAEGQVVVSGDVAAVEEAIRLAKGAGAKRAIMLNVSGAFHSPLMEPAAEGLREHLSGVDFHDPRFPVVANATAEPVHSGELARELLVKQLTSPVRWTRSIATMVAGGADRFLELGPGKVLCTLNRRNAKGAGCASVGEADDLATLEANA
jgi:[acyl-carrier-protein] S-malonyltransferase